jgi:hypothetical protein
MLEKLATDLLRRLSIDERRRLAELLVAE